MLIVSTNNISTQPMRPQSPTLTFSSPDVLHGTDSVIFKAARILSQEHGATLSPGLPSFTSAEIAAKVAAKKATLTVQPLLDGEGNKIDLMFVDMTNKVLEPNVDEIEVEFYVDPKADPKVAKTVMSMPSNTETQKYADLNAAKTALIDQKKQALAEYLVNKIIEECLEVPTLSVEFKAQFTTFEAPSI